MDNILKRNLSLATTQYDLWGNEIVFPIIIGGSKHEKKNIQLLTTQSLFAECKNVLERKKRCYLNRHYIPGDWPVEGIEDFPCVKKYCGPLPCDVVGLDERKPSDSKLMGIHGFCYDYVLEPCWENAANLIGKARDYLCALAPDFSVLADGRRCDMVEAIRRNRMLTLCLQLNGIETIQTASWGNVDSFNFVFDGLAPDCPVAIEHNANSSDPARKRLFRLGVERLIQVKRPSVLIVVGFPLGFNPGVPVVYYKSRIQKLREKNEKVGK